MGAGIGVKLLRVGKTFCTIGKIILFAGAAVLLLTIIVNASMRGNFASLFGTYKGAIYFTLTGLGGIVGAIPLYLSGLLFMGMGQLVENTGKANELLSKQ